MFYKSPIEVFITRGLQSNVDDVAYDYSVFTSKTKQDFFKYLSFEQKMDQLPKQLLKFFALRIKRLTNDYDNDLDDLIFAIQGLLINYDEMWLDDNYVDSECRDKQLYYFSLKSDVIKYIIENMNSYIIRGYFMNKDNNQSYFLMMDKEISIGYIPAGKRNGLSRSLIVVSQRSTTVMALPIDSINTSALDEVLNQIKCFLKDNLDMEFYIKSVENNKTFYIRGNYKGISKSVGV
ncbi:hypothetical protein [Companilactobacillus futsaii]|uniref:hypothetical protein n=1 Tax=Companilactobacillus futsaii TaxID=938155 RepID=UPI00189FE772|nr:hypothetical protein [Companilactobacillus futsaii]